MRLITVHDGIYTMGLDELYELLKERTVEQSISHKTMPTYREHVQFVNSRPYREWYLIEARHEVVGSIYLTKQNEIGVFIFQKHQGHGYGPLAIILLMREHDGERLLANINPNNKASIECFERLGFKHIQNTYVLTTEE